MNQPNGRTLSNEQAINILGGAFKPLCCVAQTQNVGTLMVFEVTDGTKRILKQGIPAALAHKDSNLRLRSWEPAEPSKRGGGSSSRGRCRQPIPFSAS
jgi:hypothetical protein